MAITIEAPEIVIRPSELSSINDCKRSWYWSRKRWPWGVSTGQWTGQFIHKGLEIYYKCHRDPQAVVDHYFDESRRIVLELQEKHPRSQESILTCQDQGLKYIKHYLQYDAVHPLEGKILGVEERLTHRIWEPDTHIFHPRLKLSGKIDLVLEDGGKILVIDHKGFADGTYSRLGRLEDLILVDFQLTGYAYLWWRQTGILPHRVGLNILLKNLPEPPSRLKSGSLSKSLSQKTTGALYRQTVEELGLNIDDYETVIDHFERLSYSAYFVRVYATRSLKHLHAFENHLWQIGQEISGMLLNPRLAYPSPSIYRCGSCPFIQACYEEDSGGDSEAILSGYPLVDWDSTL